MIEGGVVSADDHLTWYNSLDSFSKRDRKKKMKESCDRSRRDQM